MKNIIQRGPVTGKTVFAVLTSVFISAMLPPGAYAMHISEGILPLGWAGVWYAAAVPFVAWALFKLKRQAQGAANIKPLLGMVAAAVFIVSCMPIPIPTAGTCSHPAGTGMAAILIGPLYSILAASVALLLQALFMAHGGISTWGANVFSMGVVGSLSGYAAYAGLKRLGAPMVVAAFFAGLAGDWATYAATAFMLASALHAPGGFASLFATIAAAFVPTQLPLGILEGVMTAGAVKFLHGMRPELLGGVPSMRSGAIDTGEVKA